MQDALQLSHYLVLAGALLAAYVIFGIAGFGTALIASPVMALYIPVAKIVPLLALLDMCAALVNVSRDGRNANRPELRRLIPLMIAGSLIGALIGLSTLTRVVIFALAGVYFDADLLLLALALAPGMLLGITLGRYFTLKMSREQFLKLINMILLASGSMLIIRYLSAAL
ncbi:TPA: TSUP family transporter [Serratia rubidaea]